MVKIGFEELEARIRRDGEEEIKNIEEKTRGEVEAIKRDILEKADREAERVQKLMEAEIERLRKKIIVDANMQVKEFLNAEKNRLLDEVFQEAAESILKMSDDEKKKILQSLAEEGKKNVKDPVVLVDEKYRNLLPEAEATKLGDFGVVVVSRDKTMKVDNTMRNKLNKLKVRIKPKVAAMLFAEK